jgi:hypothetical protein
MVPGGIWRRKADGCMENEQPPRERDGCVLDG